MKSLDDVRGTIYDIQRYSLHDGPGIRTIVFMKGCPLKCPWCANPESQCVKIESMGDEVVGRQVTVKEVIDLVERDKAFFNRSGGGMTLSGGEPLMQADFAEALVAEAKKRGISVAIETSGFQRWDLLWKVVKDIDVILLDIKIMDPKKHNEIIGGSNDLILNNAQKMVEMGKEVIIRVPVIPEYTDDLDNLNEIVKFCKKIGIDEVHFLPYHQLGVQKYEKLGREYELQGIKQRSRKDIKSMAEEISKRFGVEITVY